MGRGLCLVIQTVAANTAADPSLVQGLVNSATAMREWVRTTTVSSTTSAAFSSKPFRRITHAASASRLRPRSTSKTGCATRNQFDRGGRKCFRGLLVGE